MGSLNKNALVAQTIADDAKDLISRLLKKDPRQRMALETIQNHPFILRATKARLDS